jgi:sulfur-oxidizing protein SoxX
VLVFEHPLKEQAMKSHFRSIAFVITALSLSACDLGPKSSLGFSLPAGNIEAGREAFTKFQCSDCHVVAGLETERATLEPQLNLPLGGKTPRIQSYGQLVTSIINPSHKISKKYGSTEVTNGAHSKMPNYNYAITVNELIDLVAFLQSKYELAQFEPSQYPVFIYPVGF